MFAATSRYAGLPVVELTLSDGTVIRHVPPRLIPDPAGLTVVGTHVVAPGDRLDRIAADRFGDPEQAWRIADAHRVLDPDSLTAFPGTVLRFTVPGGLLAAGVIAGG
jgi:hypothetical protein